MSLTDNRRPRPFGNPDDEPVITMQADHQRLPGTLLAMLKEQRAKTVENFASRDAKDFAEYRFWRGQIEGLDIAISFAQQAQKKLES